MGQSLGGWSDWMSVSQDFFQREIWALGSISAQLSQMSTSGKRSKCLCSPVIEEGLVSGFVCRWIPRMAPFPGGVQGEGGGWTPCPRHPGCARALEHLFPWGFGA